MNCLFIQPKSGFMIRGNSYPVCKTLVLSATYLKNNGHNVTVNDRCIEVVPINKLVRQTNAGIVFVCMSHTVSVKDAVKVSKQLKRMGLTVVWFEAFSIFDAELIFKTGCVDFVLKDEAYVSALNLANAIEKGLSTDNIKGLIFEKDGELLFTERQEFIDMAELGSTDWSLINVKKCFRSFPGCKRMLYLFASEGCPFRCSFCFYGVYTKNCRRKRPIEDVLREMDYLIDNFKLDGVNFSDELMDFTDEELEKIKNFRAEKNDCFIWGGETNPRILDRERLEKLHEAGCRFLLFGLETGSDKMRGKLNKPTDDNHVRRIIDICTQIGIDTYGSFMIGLPGETQDDLRQTVRFALSLDLDAFLFNYMIPVMGTPLFNELKSNFPVEIDDILKLENRLSPDVYPADLTKDIKTKDLAVVKAYFDFLTITRKKKKSKNNKFAGLDFVKKAISTLMGFLKSGFVDAIFSVYFSVKRVICVFSYPVIYRKIAKKYGLFNVNK